MSLIKELEKYVNEVIKDLGYETDVKIEKSKMKEFGDYQINAAMALAKQAGKNPRDIAQEIVDKFHKKNLKINVWCVDEIDELRKFEEMGVDYITTNVFNQND